MRRRTMMAVLGTTAAALAGCIADGAGDREDARTDVDTGANSVLDRFDGEPIRPECEVESETVEVEDGDETVEHETAETIPYPDPPTAFADGEIVEYVEAFEHAYVTRDVLCDRKHPDRVLNVGFGVQEHETFEWYDDVTIVFLLRAGGASRGLTEDGNEWVTDLGFHGVVYAVDQTGAARVNFDDASGLESDELESRAPDPLNEGELVAVFE